MNNRREFLIWTLVVPALLLSLSVWQIVRASSGLASEEQYRADLAEDIPALREILVSHPQAIIRFKKSGVHQPAAEALEDALRGQQHMERIAGQREIMFYLATLGALSSLAVIAAGLVGQWGIRAVQRGSMRSRSELVRSFSLWQRRLAIVLCVLAGGLCCAVFSAVGFEFWDTELRNVLKGPDVAGMVKVGVFLFAVFFVGVYAVYKILEAWRAFFVLYVTQMQGQRISPEACPALWELVCGVAERVGARPPDSIILGMEPTFYVMAGNVELYPEGEYYSGNILHLGLPLLLYLTQSELSSVLAHELGHYAGEDLEYSQRFLPLYTRTQRQLAALKTVETELESPLSKLALEPATLLARSFFDALDLGVKFWSRQRELAADEASSAVVGPDMAAATLLRVIALGPALAAALELWEKIPADEELEYGGEEPSENQSENQSEKLSEDLSEKQPVEQAQAEAELGAEPVNYVCLAGGPNGVLTFIQRVLREQGLIDPQGALADAVPHPLDTHPQTAQRLQAWGVDVDETLLRQAMRPEESSLLWEFGLLQYEEPEEGGPA